MMRRAWGVFGVSGRPAYLSPWSRAAGGWVRMARHPRRDERILVHYWALKGDDWVEGIAQSWGNALFRIKQVTRG